MLKGAEFLGMLLVVVSSSMFNGIASGSERFSLEMIEFPLKSLSVLSLSRFNEFSTRANGLLRD